MYTSVQVVFIVDVNCFSDAVFKNVPEINLISALKYSCLHLLTEFGAQTENYQNVRWACKFYDSNTFKPGKANSKFQDFDKKSFDYFVLDSLKHLSSASLVSKLRKSPNHKRQSYNSKYSHCFILNKAVQEALKDYSWDLPDFNSPAKTRNTRGKLTSDNKLTGTFNAIIVFNSVPHSDEAIQSYFHDEAPCANVESFQERFLEKSTIFELQKSKLFRLHFVDTSARKLQSDFNDKYFSRIDEYLSRFNGALHCISSTVNLSLFLPSNFVHLPKVEGEVYFQGLDFKWFGKCTRSGKSTGRIRKPQPGPLLIWESHTSRAKIHVSLEILCLQGRGPTVWKEAKVICAMRSGSSVMRVLGSSTSSVMLCREHFKSDVPPTFAKIMHLLLQRGFILLVQLSCGGLGLLAPLGGGVASLTVLSLSGLSTPPLPPCHKEDSLVELATIPLLNFIQSAIRKTLSNDGGVLMVEDGDNSLSEVEHCSKDKSILYPKFNASMLQSWYTIPQATVEAPSRSALFDQQQRSFRRSLLTRAQRRCCPNVSGLLAVSAMLPSQLEENSIHAVVASDAAARIPKVPDVSLLKPLSTENSVSRVTASRALKLVNTSKIVTAQQKVKEQQVEQSEREVARERRVLQSSLRSQRSKALIDTALTSITDTKDSAEVVHSLRELRDSVSGRLVADSSTLCPPDVSDCELLSTAQTIINLALMHVRSATDVAAASEIGECLRGVLSKVLHSWRDISSLPRHCQLAQYQLHILLHLETIWLMGYSSAQLDESASPSKLRRLQEREAHVEEILRLLRAVSLQFAPQNTTSFLSNVVLPNYEDTLSEVLVEVYEELNQPLPPGLAEPMSVGTDLVSPAQPSSLLSGAHGSLVNSVVGSGGEKQLRGVRRRTSNLAVGAGAAARQVVVPGLRMARLTRALSDQPHSKKSTTKISRARRSLFSSRSGGALHTPTRQRKRPRTDFDPGNQANKRRRLDRTPRHERPGVRRASLHEKSLKRAGLLTPGKHDLSSPSSTVKLGLRSASKGTTVLCPETPVNRTKRGFVVSCSATNTFIAESPDLKGAAAATPGRLLVSSLLRRRSSFYSGNRRSRNCERANANLMVQHMQGKSAAEVASSDSSKVSKQPQDASFLFSRIFSSEPSQCPVSRTTETDGPKRDKNLRRALNFDVLPDQAAGISQVLSIISSPISRRQAKNIPLYKLTPVKKVARALNMESPYKSDTVHNALTTPSGNELCKTPKRLDTDTARLISLSSPKSLTMTPSKRVQFNLDLTPSKSLCQNTSCRTPKSILKTPTRTPSHQHNSSHTPTRGHLTPTRRSVMVALSSHLLAQLSTDNSSSTSKAIDISTKLTDFFVCSDATTQISPKRSSLKHGDPCISSDTAPQISPKLTPQNHNISDVTMTALEGGLSPKSPVLRCSMSIDKKKRKSVNTKCDSMLPHSLELRETSAEPLNAVSTCCSRDRSPELFPESTLVIPCDETAAPVDTSGYAVNGKEVLDSSSLQNNLCNKFKYKSPSKVTSIAEFIEVLDQMALEGIADHEAPMITHEDHLLSELTGLADENSFFIGSLNESVDLAATEVNSTVPPLLDIESMIEDELCSVKFNKFWISHADSTFDESSPEIEITESDRKLIEKIIQKHKSKSPKKSSNNVFASCNDVENIVADDSVVENAHLLKYAKSEFGILENHNVCLVTAEERTTSDSINKCSEKAADEICLQSLPTLECTTHGSNHISLLQKASTSRNRMKRKSSELSGCADSAASQRTDEESSCHADGSTVESVQSDNDIFPANGFKSRRSSRVKSRSKYENDRTLRSSRAQVYYYEDSDEETSDSFSTHSFKQKRTTRALRMSNKSALGKENKNSSSSIDVAYSPDCKFPAVKYNSVAGKNNRCSKRCVEISAFSEARTVGDISLGISPLQNIGNNEHSNTKMRNMRKRTATSYAEVLTDSELDAESSLNDTTRTEVNDTDHLNVNHSGINAEKGQQEKIDRYLSPMRRMLEDQAMNCEVKPIIDVKSSSEGTIDWKVVKPMRSRCKLANKGNSGKCNRATANNKRKRKRVKLKIKKSGNQYQVSRQNFSGNSLNSTASDLHSNINESFNNVDLESESLLKKKKNSYTDYATSLRFTRHMSRDISMTPEVFQKLVASSPNSKNSVKDDADNSESSSHVKSRSKVKERRNRADDVHWRVESAESSPTIKTFIRMPKHTSDPKMSPSIMFKPTLLGSPSVFSMLHLSTSPLVDRNGVKTNAAQSSNSQHKAVEENMTCDTQQIKRKLSEEPLELPASKRTKLSLLLEESKPRSRKRLY